MITAYLRERLHPATFGPLALLIALGAAGTAVTLAGLAADAAVAFLLLAQFRLWDDLADRQDDRLTHPDRVLVAAPSVAPFVVCCLALGAANAGLTIGRHGASAALAILLALQVVLGAWYWRRSPRSLAGDQLRLAKYPAFVFVVAGPRLLAAPVTIPLAALAIYAAASFYEGWHDPASPLRALPGVRS